jgi:hypothetical protein
MSLSFLENLRICLLKSFGLLNPTIKISFSGKKFMKNEHGYGRN